MDFIKSKIVSNGIRAHFIMGFSPLFASNNRVLEILIWWFLSKSTKGTSWDTKLGLRHVDFGETFKTCKSATKEKRS